MKKIVSSSILVVLACLAGAQPAAGQEERGLGGFLDWIQRLSGPSMMGPAVSYYWGWERVRFRLTGAYRVPVASDDKMAPGYSLNMLSLQPTLEFPVGSSFEVITGISVHRFGGDPPDPVYHLSIPAYVAFRHELRSGSPWAVRIALGTNFFPKFDDGDFLGQVDVNTSRGEFSFPDLIVGFDRRIH